MHSDSFSSGAGPTRQGSRFPLGTVLNIEKRVLLLFLFRTRQVSTSLISSLSDCAQIANNNPDYKLGEQVGRATFLVSKSLIITEAHVSQILFSHHSLARWIEAICVGMQRRNKDEMWPIFILGLAFEGETTKV